MDRVTFPPQQSEGRCRSDWSVLWKGEEIQSIDVEVNPVKEAIQIRLGYSLRKDLDINILDHGR